LDTIKQGLLVVDARENYAKTVILQEYALLASLLPAKLLTAHVEEAIMKDQFSSV
jgi:hypothetical protein